METAEIFKSMKSIMAWRDAYVRTEGTGAVAYGNNQGYMGVTPGS